MSKVLCWCTLSKSVLNTNGIELTIYGIKLLGTETDHKLKKSQQSMKCNFQTGNVYET